MCHLISYKQEQIIEYQMRETNQNFTNVKSIKLPKFLSWVLETPL